jgi:hypothetical protein
VLVLESMLLVVAVKIVLQQNPPKSGRKADVRDRLLSARSGLAITPCDWGNVGDSWNASGQQDVDLQNGGFLCKR